MPVGGSLYMCCSTLHLTTSLPPLLCRPRSNPDSVERLLVRLLPRPSSRTLFTGDVVAFSSPLAVAATAAAGAMPGALGLPAAAAAAAGVDPLAGEQLQNTMVRRVAAMPGDELVTGEDEEAAGFDSIVIPEVGGVSGWLAGWMAAWLV